ncbi:MAG TPA: putative porin [Bacteroidales bacterium]|nr:putative porin [Bacteroidales bacterium]
MRCRWKYLCFLVFFILSANYLRSQQAGDFIAPPDTVAIYWFTDSAHTLHAPRLIPVDTNMSLFHRYHPAVQSQIPFASLGNVGLALTPLVFLLPKSDPGAIGINVYDQNRITPNNLKFYKTTTPFTDLRFVTGQHREQLFSGEHHQQIRRNLGLGVRFNIINSHGAYIRQKTDNSSVAANVLYYSNNRRYGLAAAIINNRFIHYESGGLMLTDPFEQNTLRDRGRMLVRLSSAENRWRESGVYARQFFKPGKTIKNDTITVNRNFLTSPVIYHTFHYNRTALGYYDRNPLGGFYREVLSDSTLTMDSTVLHSVRNELFAKTALIQLTNLNLELGLGIGHWFLHYRSMNINRKFNVTQPFVRADLAIGNRFSADAAIRISHGELYSGDREIELNTTILAGKKRDHQLRFTAKSSRISAPLFMQQFGSNHFVWNNNKEQQEFLHGEAQWRWKGLTTNISYTSIGQFVYLDSLASPAVWNNNFACYKLTLGYQLESRRFVTHNSVKFQGIINEAPFDLPNLIIRSNFALNLNLFDGALQAQLGVDLFYNSLWKAPSYMPALKSFYQQSAVNTGNYIYADLYANFRVKRARLFVLMQHANEGLMGYRYYMIYPYPMPDRSFKFGVSWMFYD